MTTSSEVFALEDLPEAMARLKGAQLHAANAVMRVTNE